MAYTLSVNVATYRTLLLAIGAIAGISSWQAQPGMTGGVRVFSMAASTVTRPQTPAFGLALIGGGGDVDDAAKFLCEHSHGGELVVLRASGGDAYNPYFHQLCPGNSVTTLLTTSPEGARSPQVMEHVRAAHAIFLAGGDQSNYVNFWAGPLQKEINEAIARGIPIGGTSAGLAVLGEFAFSARKDTVTTEEALVNPFNERVTLDRDFLSIPVLRGIITDSHFSARQRMGRTIAFLARIVHDGWVNPARAIGIDEATAVLVASDGSATVAGKGSAFFFELAHEPERCEPGKPLTVTNVLGYKLPAGATSKFDLKSWRGSGGSRFTVEVVDGTMTQSQGSS